MKAAKTAASGPGPKQQLYAQFAEMARALGHAHRLEILELLAQGERSVESLAERAGLSIGNASQHLRLMRQAGLLVSRRDGKRILYRLSDPAVLDLTAALHRLAERNLGEVKSVLAGYFNKRDSMEPVSRKELSRRLRDGLVTVLDVRPPDEFAAGQVLPGAFSGSICGRRLSGKPWSTIGFERRHNPAFRMGDESELVGAMLRDVPRPPVGAARIRAVNAGLAGAV